MLIIHCPSPCIGSPPTQINTYSRTATTIYQPSIVYLILLPTGPKQYATSQSFSKGEMDYLRKALSLSLLTASTPNGPWKGWKEGSHNLPARKVTMPTPRTLLTLTPPPLKPRPRATFHTFFPGLCKSIKKVCRKYGILTNLKGSRIIKNVLVFLRIRTPWKTKVGPSTSSNVENLYVMRSI